MIISPIGNHINFMASQTFQHQYEKYFNFPFFGTLLASKSTAASRSQGKPDTALFILSFLSAD